MSSAAHETVTRPEIQALRAVAVGAVLLFHLWPNRLPGGFVGVDVFFVISGFLITDHLVRERETTGRIRFARFWARRAKRLLPASLLVLLVVAVAAMTVVPLSQRAGVLREVMASAFYVQNWVLASDAVDYLASDAAASPVQHFWTLSIEEQFYAGLPLLLTGAGAVASVSGRSFRRAALTALALVAVVSFAYSAHLSSHDAGVAYFSTGTRAWEFAGGGLLAAVAHRIGPRAQPALAWSGALAIGAAVLLFDRGTAFPGYAAALPVLGAAAVIAGATRGPLAWASKLRPVTWIGDISYAIYLWHWPLIILLPYVTGHVLGTTEKVAIAAATICLAYLSTRFVEEPIRFSPRLLGSPRRPATVGLCCLVGMLVVSGLAYAGRHDAQAEQRRLLVAAQDQLASSELRCLGAGAARHPRPQACPDLGDTLIPSPSAVAADAPGDNGCWTVTSAPRICTVGPKQGYTKRVFAVGDSHNLMYLPAYEALGEALGWRIDVTARSACSWSTRTQAGYQYRIEDCDEWKDAIAAHLASVAPYDVILTTTLQTGPRAIAEAGETRDGATAKGLSEAWRSQIDRGSAVIAIQDTPRARKDVVRCVEREAVAAASTCSVPVGYAYQGFDALRRAVRLTPGSEMITFRDLMCERARCPPVIGNVVVYRDENHLTKTFVTTLAPILIERVRAAIQVVGR